MSEAAHASVVALMIERRPLWYDPWKQLSFFTGVEVTWHAPGPYQNWKNPVGLTAFNDLRISLQLGRREAQLRCTLTHELLHLERGPFTAERERYEEPLIERLTAKRLVDPALFDALVTIHPDPDWRQVAGVLNVDSRTFRTYAGWRKRVSTATAHRTFEQFNRGFRAEWPAQWLRENPMRDTFAARAAGVTR